MLVVPGDLVFVYISSASTHADLPRSAKMKKVSFSVVNVQAFAFPASTPLRAALTYYATDPANCQHLFEPISDFCIAHLPKQGMMMNSHV